MSQDADLELPTQDEVQHDLMDRFRGAVRMVLESLLEEEVRRMIGVSRWERWGHRNDHRNGSYLRRLLTTMGWIDLQVPRTRQSGAPVGVVGRYRRRQSEVDAAVVEAYARGVSTRGMGKVTQALVGDEVKRSTVSRITRALQDQVEDLRRAPIDQPVPYLYLDGTFLNARWARRVENVAALVAYGVGADGHRRLLAVTIGCQESEESWAELLQQLLARGLRGVQLVIADAHVGLAAAARRFLPDARLQRCIVHLQRNVTSKAPRRLRSRVAREVSRVFDAPNLQDARRRLNAFKQNLGSQVPEAVACLEAAFPAASQFFAFPRAHWIRLRSTNGLERLHGELKRRIRSAGAFPDRHSALRLLTAVALRVTAVWADRRYLDMSLLHPAETADEASVIPN